MIVTLPEQSWIDQLPSFDGLQCRVWDVRSAPDVALDEVGSVVLPYLHAPTALETAAQMPNLVSIQTMTAGFDGLPERTPPGVLLCNAAGVHDASTAELAVGLTLAGQRGIGRAVLEQVAGEWHSVRNPSLADRRVLVVGVGGVGHAICERLAPFEVQITRVASRERDDEHSARFGRIRAIDDLPTLVAEHEVVILAVPLSEATRDLFDAELLARMPDDSLLVSVARGPVVNTDALTAELHSGRIRAALDVIDPEPLPAEHPIRQAPGLVLTPHFGGNSTAFEPRMLKLLRSQCTLLARGERPANVVYTG